MKNRIFFLSALLFLSGCAGSPYTYYVKPTPIEKGVTKYNLESVQVNLRKGPGAIAGDKSFSSQDELTQQFTDALKKALEEKHLVAGGSGTGSADVEVNIDYERHFNIGGRALNKPVVSHSVLVERGGQRLARVEVSDYTTSYGYLGDAAVNMEIAAFSWDAEDELRDVDLIAKEIVEDIAALGD